MDLRKPSLLSEVIFGPLDTFRLRRNTPFDELRADN
ncbi:MAG: hypothetical protein RIT43_1255 [Bacteroidota bacterium]|jgi:hypothetical protein